MRKISGASFSMHSMAARASSDYVVVFQALHVPYVVAEMPWFCGLQRGELEQRGMA